MHEIKEQVREFLERFIQEQYSDEDDFYLLGYVDSLFAMKLLVFIEQEFDIIIEDEDLNIKNISSVNSIAELIQTKSIL